MRLKKNILLCIPLFSTLIFSYPISSCNTNKLVKLIIDKHFDDGFENTSKILGEYVDQKLIIRYDLKNLHDININESSIKIGDNNININDYINKLTQEVIIPSNKVNNCNIYINFKSINTNKIKPNIHLNTDNINARANNIEAKKDDLTIQYAAPFGISSKSLLINGVECIDNCEIDEENRLITLYKDYITNDEEGKLIVDIYLSGYGENAEDYIFNRTFSISTMKRIYDSNYDICWGTCWIIKDATPNILDDFWYYIATNWHVKLGLQNLNDSKCYFASSKSQAGINPFDFKYNIEFSSFEWINDSQMTYTGSTKSAIDMSIAKVDMSNCLNVPDMNDKLNTINEFYEANDYITNFANVVDDDNNFANEILYVGGYPVDKEKKQATWKFHSLDDEGITLEYEKYNDHYHIIDYIGNIIDVSPQYYSQKKVKYNWLGGGSSGSMLIMEDKNITCYNKWKVVGIYWGGGGYEFIDIFYPYFSIFKHITKDFLNFKEW